MSSVLKQGEQEHPCRGAGKGVETTLRQNLLLQQVLIEHLHGRACSGRGASAVDKATFLVLAEFTVFVEKAGQ